MLAQFLLRYWAAAGGPIRTTGQEDGTMRNYKLALLAIAMTAMAATAAKAAVLYSDGSANGTYDAFTISSGQQVEDSFNLTGQSSVTGAPFGNWLLPGDTGSTVGW